MSVSAQRPAELSGGPSVVAIGTFDGVHRGHQVLVRRAVRAAAGRGLRAIAVTFHPHPAHVVRPDEAPALLMIPARRVRTLRDTGADDVAVLAFDEDLSRSSPEGFVNDVLVDGLGARHVVVGGNFRFGHRGAGDVAVLRELGRDRGFEVEVVELLHLAGTRISSSEIRSRLVEGDLDWACRALGRPHIVDGTVVEGDRRGRELGVPTANVQLPEAILLPALGVYAGRVRLPSGDRVPAATSIGERPTFGRGPVTIEAHLIDWQGDLYGEQVGVELRYRLRGEEHFDDVDALVRQMRRDIAEATRILG